MIDYIEEMMRTAEVTKNIYFNPPLYPNGISIKQLYSEPRYPDFTPEKQIEIIKLIIKLPKAYNLTYDKDFTQALAQLTTELIKVGELDKEKVKEILEC